MEEGVYESLCSLDANAEIPIDLRDQVPEESISAIRRQARQRYLREQTRVHRRQPNLKRYIAKYRNGQTIEELAGQLQFSSCLLARILLEAILKCDRKKTSEFMKNPALIPDKRLQQEIYHCVEIDTDFSPYIDRIRHTMGMEYEYILHQKLRNYNVPFESEEALRARGLSKTPDALLEVPFGVQTSDGSFHVINWIDSKAMFGDRHVHDSDNLLQLQGYVNRFGPGMVIYWFGFLSALNSDTDILLQENFPTDIVLPQLLTSEKEPEAESVLYTTTEKIGKHGIPTLELQAT